MYPNSIYFGLKVVTPWILEDRSFYFLGSETPTHKLLKAMSREGRVFEYSIVHADMIICCIRGTFLKPGLEPKPSISRLGGVQKVFNPFCTIPLLDCVTSPRPPAPRYPDAASPRFQNPRRFGFNPKPPKTLNLES